MGRRRGEGAAVRGHYSRLTKFRGILLSIFILSRRCRHRARVRDQLRNAARIGKPRPKDDLLGIKIHLIRWPPDDLAERIHGGRGISLRVGTTLEKPGALKMWRRIPIELSEIYLARRKIYRRIWRKRLSPDPVLAPPICIPAQTPIATKQSQR